ncbi:citrate/2-methylcitrate synthase [Burkholderia sp. WP9]|uniref:citrate/2-methylcitrate synthase n=1 Tax=Burkholderia sp. WP9 TaxID=1500263 RepID=UPI000B2545DA|nr:citrate/2-methylcitrate synthase [Burkholderia sp. WP9]
MGRAAAEEKPAHARTFADMCDEAAVLIGRLASSFIDLHAGEEPIHLRIARAWGVEARADLLRRTLVLLADQELNSSAFAARVTASTGASLGACALTGLAALSGPLHGDANVRVQALLDEAKQCGTEIAVRHWMASGASLPGFGHQLYPQGDRKRRVRAVENSLDKRRERGGRIVPLPEWIKARQV